VVHFMNIAHNVKASLNKHAFQSEQTKTGLQNPSRRRGTIKATRGIAEERERRARINDCERLRSKRDR